MKYLIPGIVLSFLSCKQNNIYESQIKQYVGKNYIISKIEPVSKQIIDSAFFEKDLELSKHYQTILQAEIDQLHAQKKDKFYYANNPSEKQSDSIRIYNIADSQKLYLESSKQRFLNVMLDSSLGWYKVIIQSNNKDTTVYFDSKQQLITYNPLR